MDVIECNHGCALCNVIYIKVMKLTLHYLILLSAPCGSSILFTAQERLIVTYHQQPSQKNNIYETIFWPKVPLCTSLVSHNFVWGTLYCSCMHFYASSSHSIMSLSIKMQGNIKTSGICLIVPMGSTEKCIIYYSNIFCVNHIFVVSEFSTHPLFERHIYNPYI